MVRLVGMLKGVSPICTYRHNLQGVTKTWMLVVFSTTLSPNLAKRSTNPHERFMDLLNPHDVHTFLENYFLESIEGRVFDETMVESFTFFLSLCHRYFIYLRSYWSIYLSLLLWPEVSPYNWYMAGLGQALCSCFFLYLGQLLVKHGVQLHTFFEAEEFHPVMLAPLISIDSLMNLSAYSQRVSFFIVLCHWRPP